jgi:hypothetical protein
MQLPFMSTEVYLELHLVHGALDSYNGAVICHVSLIHDLEVSHNCADMFFVSLIHVII